MRHIKIEENEANQRLDRFMNKYLDKAPKSLIQKYIRKKKIKVNKKKANPLDILEVGDIVNIYIYDETIAQYRSEKDYLIVDEELDYLYQDKNIAIINKPAGVLMYGGEELSLLDIFISDMIKSSEFNPKNEITFSPTFSNRLDRNTAGLLIGCKNSNSLRLINELFRDNKIEKRYRTIVNGIINKETVVDEKIEEISNNEVIISDKGKRSVSIFTPISLDNEYTLIDAKLITGRKHQLRVHLKSIGHPIIGDHKYGKGENLEKFNIHGQYLISYKLIFKEVTGSLSYLSNKEFILEDKYFNNSLERHYLELE